VLLLLFCYDNINGSNSFRALSFTKIYVEQSDKKIFAFHVQPAEVENFIYHSKCVMFVYDLKNMLKEIKDSRAEWQWN
jgi:hypothetical protein